jgi:hypothetical protein
VSPVIRRSIKSLIALTVLGLASAACGPAITATPSATQPSAGPSSASPASVPPSSAPSAAPSTSTSAAAACPIAPQTGRLPSDRLVGIIIAGSDTADVVTFQFGNDSLPGPAGAPEGTLETAQPPFIQGGSGEPQEVIGEHVALVRFAGMSIANDVGQPVYQGELEMRPDLPALRDVVNMEMFEGVVSWYIGYDGSGCVTLSSDGQNVSVTIEHPAG